MPAILRPILLAFAAFGLSACLDDGPDNQPPPVSRDFNASSGFPSYSESDLKGALNSAKCGQYRTGTSDFAMRHKDYHGAPVLLCNEAGAGMGHLVFWVNLGLASPLGPQLATRLDGAIYRKPVKVIDAGTGAKLYIFTHKTSDESFICRVVLPWGAKGPYNATGCKRV